MKHLRHDPVIFRRERDEDEDRDDAVQRALDDADDALAWFDNSAFKPSAAELSLQQALMEGQRAGAAGKEAAENPYQAGIAEHAEWERGRAGAQGLRRVA